MHERQSRRCVPAACSTEAEMVQMADHVTHSGGCHCGRVRFEVDAPARLEVLDCNCSICRLTGFLHLIVPSSAFRLLAGTAG